MFRTNTQRFSAYALLIFALAACGDGPTGPGIGAGLYQLTTVGGRPLPFVLPPSMGIPLAVGYGLIDLRTDGTFRVGMGPQGMYQGGTYQITDGQLLLTPGDGQPTTIGLIAGDSIQIDWTFRFVFKRMAASAGGVTERAILDAINDAGPPFLHYDTIIGDQRYVARIHFDSITFDGRFYRRHRYEAAGSHVGSDSAYSFTEWTAHGILDRTSAVIVLRPFMHLPNVEPLHDSLWVAPDGLTRRVRRFSRLINEHYSLH